MYNHNYDIIATNTLKQKKKKKVVAVVKKIRTGTAEVGLSLAGILYLVIFHY